MLHQVGRSYFIKIECDLIVAVVAGKRDTVTIGDLSTDTRFAHGHRLIAWHELQEFVTVDNLKVIEPRQQHTEADHHKGSQQVKSEAVAGFDH